MTNPTQEIPSEEQTRFADNAYKNNFYRSNGQRNGFDTGYKMGAGHEYLRARQQAQGETVKQLLAKEQECADYRKALEEIKNGKSSLHHTYEGQLTATDMALIAHQTLNKYPSPPTK